MTRQQKLICQILQSGSGHLTAEEIFFLARKERFEISNQTINPLKILSILFLWQILWQNYAMIIRADFLFRSACILVV